MKLTDLKLTIEEGDTYDVQVGERGIVLAVIPAQPGAESFWIEFPGGSKEGELLLAMVRARTETLGRNILGKDAPCFSTSNGGDVGPSARLCRDVAPPTSQPQ